MSVSRITRLAALKRKVEYRKWQMETGRLVSEIQRLDDRISQVEALKSIYQSHLTNPSLTARELIGIRIINMHLNDRRDLDQSRLTLLAEERQRLMAMLAAKKREVDMLEDETKRLKRNEAEEKLEKIQALIPTHRV
ncbi:MAG: hypothetical protein FJX04_01965 [Alphaproteobacteria bacterium]|nr:hypothetical protein [Alphaproteobacteria bacterium]